MLEKILEELKSRPFTLSTSKGSRGKRVWCVSYLGEDLVGDDLLKIVTKVLEDFKELEAKAKNV
jgi:hypothetical protein